MNLRHNYQAFSNRRPPVSGQKAMETASPDTEGHSDLPSKLDFALAPRETDPTPVVTSWSEVSRAEPTSAMITRSRAREGRGISVVPEIQFEPEPETRPEQEISEPQVSVRTCEGGLEAARPSTIETGSKYVIVDKPEITEITASLEISSSPSTENTQISISHTDPMHNATPPPHTGSHTGLVSSASRSSTLSAIISMDTSMPILSLHGNVC